MKIPGDGPLGGLSRPRPNPIDLARIREWAQTLLCADDTDDDEVMIVVNELACREPGCPPIETVIAVISPPPGRCITIHKPCNQITETDVATAITGPDHSTLP